MISNTQAVSTGAWKGAWAAWWAARPLSAGTSRQRLPPPRHACPEPLNVGGLCVSQCVGSPKFLSPRSPVARQTHAIANHRYTHHGPRPIVVFVNVERVRSLAPARRLGRLLLSASLDHGMGVCV